MTYLAHGGAARSLLGSKDMENRRAIRRVGLRVIHRHRLGDQTLRRVSELVFLRGEPKAVLEWIDSGGLRTPIYVDIDREKLRMTRGIRTLYYYDGTTVDPRLVELTSSSEQREQG